MRRDREKSKDLVCLFLWLGFVFLLGPCVAIRARPCASPTNGLNEYIHSAVFFCTVKHLYSLYLFYNKDYVFICTYSSFYYFLFCVITALTNVNEWFFILLFFF